MMKKILIGHGRQNIILLFIAFVFLLSAVWGCAVRPKHYSKPEANVKNIKKVAVLPFENLTTDELAAEKVRRAVIAELLVKGVEVVEPGEITRVMRELNIGSSGGIESDNLQKMGEMLGVEVFMDGSVGSYNVRQGVNLSYPEVSIHLMLLEASSGDIIWSAWHTSGGPGFMARHFGTEVPSLTEATKKVVNETIDMLF